MPNNQSLDRLKFFEEYFITSEIININDSSELFSLINKFKKIENLYHKKYKHTLIKKKIAVLGSYTNKYIADILRLHLYYYNISPSFYFGEFDNVPQEFLIPNSGLYNFKPDMVILLTLSSDIKKFPNLFSSKKDVELWTEKQINHYKIYWDKINEIPCQLFQTNFVKPIEKQLGNLEANYHFSRWSCIDYLNIKLAEKHPSNVTIIDAEYLASLVGRLNWFSEKNYFISKQGMSFEVMNLFVRSLSNTIVASLGKIKKCLVLDLDNTLWGGIIGDDDLEGINLDPNNAVGEAFIQFQKYVKQLKERGILLAVCSKNESEIAKLPFQKHPNMILKLEDISCFIANWKDKHINIREIADTLNIGLDSIVFFDDNPVERGMVSEAIPEVSIVNVPEDPAQYIRVFELEMHFDWAQLSLEDITRSNTIIANKKRESLEKTSYSYDDYLKNLKMYAKISEVSSLEFSRFVQLINKTNQFNLRTKRYTVAEVEDMKKDKNNYKIISVSLKDKFSNYGVISGLIIFKKNKEAFIDTWVMSCRVFGRNLEQAIFNSIIKIMEEWECDKIIGEYLPTKKNKIVKNLYSDLGFYFLQENDENSTSNPLKFCIEINGAREQNHFITIDN
jgi:FkbH-like protein